MSTYTVTFERIGRNHAVAPLTTDADSADDLAEEIYRYARGFLGSRDVEVIAELDNLCGRIYCGMRIGGHFTIELSQ